MKKNGNRATPTLRNIANRAGVSITTVSRILNNRARQFRIKKETEQKVLKIAQEMQYVPNQLARGLRLKKTNIIGLIIPDVSNPFFSSIAQRVEMEARKIGYSVIFCDTQDNTQIEKDSIRLLLNRKVDGIIICPVGKEAEHLEKINRNNDVPIVIVDRHFPRQKCPYVISDNYRGAKEAVNYLIKNGHRYIACIQGLTHTSVNNDRVRGYKNALKENNIPFEESMIIGDSFGEKNGYVSAKILLHRVPRPTAIFALSNLISLGALRAISEEGLGIPDDISMISFDDQPYSNYLLTPMTTVTQRKNEMGEIAFKLLIEQIESNTHFDNEGVILPTKLIIRKSVKNIAELSIRKAE